MKIVATALILLSVVAQAAEVRLAWDPNSEPDLAGYKVYVGDASRAYTRTDNVGNVTMYTVVGLAHGKNYFFAATAYDTSSNESGFSNEVSGAAWHVTPERVAEMELR
ncbi:MAG: hypothetical protein EHM36_00175 [Deltaproteobacteria bacterium]|nr:MAG: hypothetical protein EHM36_00175 [Deltaproteobacteria bacterium]